MANLSPGARLRLAWTEAPIMIPGAFNALTARMAEREGFSAVYLSGGALSAGWAGVPDIGLLGLGEFVDAVRTLAQSTNLPMLCDADTGFGEAVNVERTVTLYEQAGAAGLHLEDQDLPKRCGHLSGKSLIASDRMVAKIRAATSARRDPDFVIVARTDARSVEGFDAAVRRGRDYLAAGADMIFPEALESIDEFRRYAEEVPAPLIANMTEFGRGPLLDFDTLAGAGYRAVLYPLTPFRTAMRAARETLRALRRDGHQRDEVGKMLDRSELYDLIGYDDWNRKDLAYFGPGDGTPREGPADR